MADDFAYLNARVRARRSSLLKEAFFREALDLPYPDFLRLLSESVYGQELAGQGLPQVDRAITRTQARLVGDLPRLVTGRPGRWCASSSFAMTWPTCRPS